MKITSTIVVIVFLLVAACNHTVETPGNNTPSTPVNTGNGNGNNNNNNSNNSMVCFETEVLPILKSSCAKSGCHDAQSKQEGYVLDSYANIMKKGIKPFQPNNSDIYEAITEDDEDDRMPLPPNPRLTAAQINTIKKWINEGAVNTTNCGNACNTDVFTFSGGVKPILDANCVGCHNNATTNAGVNLSTYTGVVSAAQSGRLLGAINHAAGYKPMPQGSAKLNDCNISIITKWVQAGSPNN